MMHRRAVQCGSWFCQVLPDALPAGGSITVNLNMTVYDAQVSSAVWFMVLSGTAGCAACWRLHHGEIEHECI